MLLSSLLWALSLIGQSVLSHPLDSPSELSNEDVADIHKRQTTIVPIAAKSGAVQPRLEIRQMQTEQPNQFTLLILAMEKWENKSQSDATGYYQISGIHGVPRQDFNGVGECSTCSGADGYCTHDSVLFPAWHRTYVALYEQEFMKVVRNIADTWPKSSAATTRAEMQSAASTMRWPYWDWAAIPPSGTPSLPDVVSAPTIAINTQTGLQTLLNPLYKHHFADPSDLVYTPFTTWGFTLRYPTTDTAAAKSQEASCVTALNNIRASLQDQVYQLFSTCTDYLHFSNDDAGSSSTSCHNSLEGIHNTIHTTTGGVPSTSVKTVGHMYYLATAGFDPVFWLHHANVDRLFAMWQTINPSSYGASQAAPHHTWTIAKGTTQNANSPLTPFCKNSACTKFWTTKQVEDWTKFGYTYPEFSDSNGSSTAIQSYINVLYGPSATATAGSSKRTAIPEPAAFAEALPTPAPAAQFGPPTSLLPALTASNGSTFQYVANIETPRYSLGGSYYVFVFLGAPASEDPTTWMTDPSLVGPMGILAQDNMESRNVTVAGSIPITRALAHKVSDGVIGHLGETIIGPYLEEALEWRILGPNGTSIDPDDVEGFSVSVYASTATPFGTDGNCLPKWSNLIPMPSVTRSKKGGAKWAEFPGGWSHDEGPPAGPPSGSGWYR